MVKMFSTIAALALLSHGLAGGAEIQLRTKCQAQGRVVTVGDVAEILATDPQEARLLASLELFPAPGPGQQRILRIRELQDLLAARPIDLSDLRVSGASQVVVVGAGEPAAPDVSRPTSPSTLRRAERLVREAVLRHLREQVPGDDSWNLEVALTDAQARQIPIDSRGIAVRGGRSPWTGTQQFDLAVDSPTQPTRLEISLDVSRRSPVVVANVPLSAGAVLRLGDLKLVPAAEEAGRAEGFHRIEDVVGWELVRSVTAGTVLQSSLVRAPILIRRGEVVTVYARSPGLRVRITARARQDGGLGELIAVESLADRKVYTARVSGTQEAEVYARAFQARSAPPADLPENPAGTLARDQKGSWK
jgi:flagella basal body P-ring formation protein FlgA